MSANKLLLIVSLALSYLCNATFASASQTVVLVEDNCVCARVAQTKLGALGFEVQTAIDGAQGLKLARQLANTHTHFIVITDIHMPVMDGLALVKTMRADELLKSVPIICMSDKENETQAMSAGANAFVSKPFDNHSFNKCMEFMPRKTSN